MLRKIFLVFSISLIITAAAYAQDSSAGPATAAKTGSAKKPAVFRPTKDQITQVQIMLKDKKLYTGEASGTYNDPTREAIKSFQKDNGLKDSGTLNRATLEKFGVELIDSQKLIPVSSGSFASRDASTEKPASPTTKAGSGTPTATSNKPKKPAPFRATAEQIKAAQKMMKDKSMYTGDETGKLDDATREGLKKFQQGSGIKVTGTLNPLTLEKMGIELTDKQKADASAASAVAPKS